MGQFKSAGASAHRWLLSPEIAMLKALILLAVVGASGFNSRSAALPPACSCWAAM